MKIRSLLCILILIFFQNAFANPQPTLSDAKDKNERLKVAICYWGLTRSAKVVYKSHRENLFDVLSENNVNFDIYMHTWYMSGKQRVWGTEIDTPIDYLEYQYLNPDKYKIDDQDVFTNSIDLSPFDCNDGASDEWTNPLILLNHICALESQKRVTDMMMENATDYDAVIFVRPDALLQDKFPIEELFNLGNRDILIPNWGFYSGYNDQFAVLAYRMALIYGKRINEIHSFYASQGRIRAEKFVKFICDTYRFNVKLINFRFYLIRPS